MTLSNYRISADHLDSAAYYLLAIIPIILSPLLFSTLGMDESYSLFYFSLKLAFLLVIFCTALNFAGIILYGSPRRENQALVEKFLSSGWESDDFLIVCFTSYGKNQETIRNSLLKASQLLLQHDIPHRLEVLLEIDLREQLSDIPNLDIIIIPPTYNAPSGSLYKARALHYGVERRRHCHSSLDNLWVLHCDEESILTLEALSGIASFITKPENRTSIGQGEIHYNGTQYGENILIATIDSMRTGDDLGRFRMQYKFLHECVIGVHGSYLLVPAAIEDTVGFDHGPQASLTEDAYFAFFASMRGVKFKWIGGYLTEQSPFTLGDIFKQRRRWFNGLMNLCLDVRIPLKKRALLVFSTMCWRIYWMCIYVQLLGVFNCIPCPLTLQLVCAFFYGCSISIYLIGIYRNLLVLKMRISRKIWLFTRMSLLIPIAAFLETCMVVYAVMKPSQKYHIVRKDLIPVHSH